MFMIRSLDLIFGKKPAEGFCCRARCPDGARHSSPTNPLKASSEAGWEAGSEAVVGGPAARIRKAPRRKAPRRRRGSQRRANRRSSDCTARWLGSPRSSARSPARNQRSRPQSARSSPPLRRISDAPVRAPSRVYSSVFNILRAIPVDPGGAALLGYAWSRGT